MKNNYLVVTANGLNIDAFKKHTPQLPGQWHLITDTRELTLENLNRINPAYIFFPHWSHFVPVEITNNFNCVCFHMTDLPFGRGGSPLQNCIIRGLKDTKLTALKMTQELDAGPIYTKAALSLNGSAQQIYLSAANLCYKLIQKIIRSNIKPIEQSGEVSYFKRRKPEQSEMNMSLSLEALYDFIRMLDAIDYPFAFLEQDNSRIEFRDAQLEDGALTAKVKITKL